jgi:AraC-like DNA-binding protein
MTSSAPFRYYFIARDRAPLRKRIFERSVLCGRLAGRRLSEPAAVQPPVQSGNGAIPEAGRFYTEEIARKDGFGNRERMRRSFVRAFGHSPQAIQRTAGTLIQ